MARRPGDWDCPGCGDLQFARNATCRKCGTPKPEADDFSDNAGARTPVAKDNGQQMKDGDWICEACGDLQFARNTSCRRCGAPPPGFEPPPPARMPPASASRQEFRADDWTCPNCGDHVFGRNDRCRRCDTPRHQPMAPMSFAPAPRPTGRADNQQQMKDGDWICPMCGDLVFARNDACRSCGGRRPGMGMGMGKGGKGGMGMGMGMMPMMPMMPMFGGGKGFGCNPMKMAMMMMQQSAAYCGFDKGGFGGGGKCAGGKDAGKGGEDWICANCGDLQFGRNVVCRMCNTPKTTRPMERSINGQEPREGDWTCPACGDLQFARNEACRKCATPRPPMGMAKGGVRSVRALASPAPAARGRASSKGGGGSQEMRPGDWNCPSCGDLQFARNEACRRCGEPKPADDEEASGGGRSRSPRRESLET